MYDKEYAITKKVDVKTVAEGCSRVRELLKTEGFGVLTEIDVQATLKKKIDVDRKPFMILGACNATLANRALEVEPSVGVFLPCNVNVFEGDDGAVYVQTPHPTGMFAMMGNPSIEPIAMEVEAKLRRVIEKM